jgi:hypothetical protein
MKGTFVLIGFFALLGTGAYFGLLGRHVPAAGDRRTIFAGVFFIYLAGVMLIAPKHADDWLFALLSRRGNAFLLAIVLAVVGTALLIVGSLPRTAP